MSKLTNLGLACAALLFVGAAVAADEQTTAVDNGTEAAAVATQAPAADQQAPVSKEATVEKKSTETSNSDSVAATTEKVNINDADAKTLMTVKGIDEKMANAIVDYRTKNGAFKTVDDLTNVKCISKKTFKKISKNLTV